MIVGMEGHSLRGQIDRRLSWLFAPALVITAAGALLIPFAAVERLSTAVMAVGIATFSIGLLIKAIVGPLRVRIASAALALACLTGEFILLTPNRPKGALFVAAALILLVLFLGRKRFLAS